jgi:hypothetical protein
MNKKLTISIDNSTIEKAKAYAKSSGQSLSEIIESYLKLISKKTEKPVVSSKVSKLKGSIQLPEESYKALLKQSISDKY